MLPKLVITDIDGVWTDGGMYYTAEGDVMKRFSVKDGWGVIFLHKLDTASWQTEALRKCFLRRDSIRSWLSVMKI